MLKTLNYDIHAYDCETLNGQTTYTANHGLGTTNILCTLVDPAGDILNGSNMFTLTDNSVTVNIVQPVFTGVYKLSIYYEDGSSNYNKKKLFEQNLVSYDKLNQYSDWRVAIGKSEAMTQNVTLNDFKNGMAGQNLPYLSNNPANWSFTLMEQLTAQSKLDVYSQSLVDNMYSSVYPVTGIIDNVSSFTRNTTNLSNDPSVTTAIHPSGVHLSMIVYATGAELSTSTPTNIGSFTIEPLSAYSIASDSNIFTCGILVDNNNIIQGMAKIELTTSVVSGDVKVNVAIGTIWASSAKTIYFSVDIPIEVTALN